MTPWEYTDTHVDGYRLRTARTRSLMPLCAVDGHLVHAWLEFGDHALSGPQARIRLSAGDIDPQGVQRVRVAVDGGTPWTHRAGAAPAAGVLALRDARALWWRLHGGRLLSVRVPVLGQRMPLATFDLSTLARHRLPWDEAAVERRRRRAQAAQGADATATRLRERVLSA